MMLRLLEENLPEEMRLGILEMREYLKAFAKHEKLNAKTRLKNKAIKIHNVGRPIIDPNRMKILRLPHPIPLRLRKKILSELYNKQDRNKVSWEEWQERIDEIRPIDLRNRVGCMVWWDQVGPGTGGKPTEIFDKYLYASIVPCDTEATAIALYKIGYSAWSALKRVKPLAGQRPESGYKSVRAFDIHRQRIGGLE